MQQIKLWLTLQKFKRYTKSYDWIISKWNEDSDNKKRWWIDRIFGAIRGKQINNRIVLQQIYWEMVFLIGKKNVYN